MDGQKAMLYQVVDRIDIYRDRVEIHVNIKLWSRSNRFIGTVYYMGCKLGIVSSVTSIGHGAFYDCKYLSSIKYRGTEDQWYSISKGENWSLGIYGFTVTYNYTGA